MRGDTKTVQLQGPQIDNLYGEIAIKGRTSKKELKQVDPVEVRSLIASIKGRINSRIRCLQRDLKSTLREEA